MFRSISEVCEDDEGDVLMGRGDRCVVWRDVKGKMIFRFFLLDIATDFTMSPVSEAFCK